MIEIDIEKKLHGISKDMKLDINLQIKDGEFLALTGKSGSGKTTLLRVLSGLEDARGVIKVDDKLWLDGKNSLSPQKREIGFVFQEYALFPNMSVEDNLLYVKKDKKLASKLLEMVELTKLNKRLPATLSGGQKQRVALCRAMMNKPKLLLMDEPLSALDPYMRAKLQQEILLFHKEFQTTTILVSHEPSEIYRVANRVVVLDSGVIVNDGTPKEVLLKTKGSQKFSFEGEILDIIKVDVIYMAVVSVAQQLVEVVISSAEAKELKVGQRVSISTKAFSPTIETLDNS